MPSPFWGIYCVHNLYNLNCQIIIFIWKRIRRIQVVKFEISNALASEIYDYLCLLNVRLSAGQRDTESDSRSESKEITKFYSNESAVFVSK